LLGRELRSHKQDQELAELLNELLNRITTANGGLYDMKFSVKEDIISESLMI